MDLASRLTSRLLQNLSPELHADKIQLKQFFCQITMCSFEFLSFDKVFLLDHHLIINQGCPDRVIISIKIKPNILQKTLFH